MDDNFRDTQCKTDLTTIQRFREEIPAIVDQLVLSCNRKDCFEHVGPEPIPSREAIIDILRQTLTRGERIELRGFGVLLVKPKKAGIGRNPKRPTEEVQIPPGFTIRFKPGKELRNMTGPPEKPAMKSVSSSPRASGNGSP